MTLLHDCAFCGSTEFYEVVRADRSRAVHCRKCTAWVGEVQGHNYVEHVCAATLEARAKRPARLSR